MMKKKDSAKKKLDIKDRAYNKELRDAKKDNKMEAARKKAGKPARKVGMPKKKK